MSCLYAPEEDVLVQDQLDGWGMSRELYFTKACPTFLRSSEQSCLRIMIRALRDREDERTCCQEMLWKLAVTTDTYLGLERITNWKDTSQDLGGIAYVMGSQQATTHPFHYRLIQWANTNTDRCTPVSRLDRLRLIFDLQILVLKISLLSSVAITTYASHLQAMYGRSLFVRPSRLRAWTWPSSGRFGRIASILQSIEVGMVNLSLLDFVRFCT